MSVKGAVQKKETMTRSVSDGGIRKVLIFELSLEGSLDFS